MSRLDRFSSSLPRNRSEVLDSIRNVMLKRPVKAVVSPLSSVLRKASYVTQRVASLLAPDPRFAEIRRWQADNGDETLRLDYPLTADSVVLDVGGYKGQWASDINGRYRCRVFVFEPVPEFAQRIQARFAGNPAITVYPAALTASGQCGYFVVAGDASSAFLANGPRQECSAMTLPQFLRESGVTTIDLMKLNIEGGEYELLEGMLDSGLASTVRHFQIQFHDIAPDSRQRMEAIRARLATTHTQQWCYEFVWEGWTRKSQGQKER